MKQRHQNDERIIMTLSLMNFLSDTGQGCTWEKGVCPVRVADLDQLLHREPRWKSQDEKVLNITCLSQPSLSLGIVCLEGTFMCK